MQNVMNGKIEENQVVLYIDDMPDPTLHAVKNIAYAVKKGGGKYLVTDECEARGGYPIVNGIRVKLYGAGENWVYLSAFARDNDIRYYVGDVKIADGKSVSISRKKLSAEERAAYRKANEFYMALI